ncbi:hypothetical protein BS17DRAFT_763335 [Gyrodon lividus]|nr:hypothetical protein BS17DRAFT_763335 [Gyrodon lividus]
MNVFVTHTTNATWVTWSHKHCDSRIEDFDSASERAKTGASWLGIRVKLFRKETQDGALLTWATSQYYIGMCQPRLLIYNACILILFPVHSLFIFFFSYIGVAGSVSGCGCREMAGELGSI